MKRLYMMIAILLSLLILLGLADYRHKNNYGNTDIIYVDRSSAINMVCEFDDTYYYAGDSGIYNNNKCVLNTDEKPLIFANDDTLFVYADKEIIGYDKALSPVCKYKISEKAESFSVSDNEIFYIDAEGGFHVLDKTDSKDKHGIETVEDDIIIHRCTDFSICEDINDHSISAFLDNKVVSFEKDYSKQFVYLSDNCLIQTSKRNTSTINLYKTVLSDRSNDNIINLPTDYGVVSLFAVDNDIIFIGSEYPLEPNLGFNASNTLKHHQSDCIVTVSIDDYKITNTRFTKKHEKIIYADNKIAVTFYKGKYLTYSIDEWKVIDSQSADNIQAGNSYNFKTCGDCILVFNDAGEMVDRISVKDE